MLLVPGLVDMHAHVYPPALGPGLSADELVPLLAAQLTMRLQGMAG